MTDFVKFMVDRQADILKGIGTDDIVPEFVPTIFDPADIEKAAKKYAKNNRSDPFAYARAKSRMQAGIFTPWEFDQKDMSI